MMVPRVVRLTAALFVLLAVAVTQANASEEVCGRTFVSANGTLYQLSRGSLYDVIPGRICVRFAPSISTTRIDSLNTAFSAWTARVYEWGPRVIAFSESRDPLELLRAYCGSPIVEMAELSTIARPASEPNDTYYGSRQWNMDYRHMDLQHAWDEAVGDTTVIVGIIDTGIPRTHEDLSGATWVNWAEHPDHGGEEGVDDDENGYIDDVYGWNFHDDSNDITPLVEEHGTAIGGIVGAITNNATGIAGIVGGWSSSQPGQSLKGCLLIQGAVSMDDGNAEFAAAIRYAANNGAAVINMSWTTGENDVVKNAIKYAVDTLGVVCVAASGNGSSSVKFPACLENVVAVGATWKNDEFAERYSDYGPEQSVVAPSGPCKRDPDEAPQEYEECYDQPGNYVFAPHDSEGYDEFSGTSCAAPHVSGLAALMASAYPELDAAEIRSVIERSAEDLVGDDDTRRHDDYYGYGRVNAYAALFVAAGGGTLSSDTRLCYNTDFDRDILVEEGVTLIVLSGDTLTFSAGVDSCNLGVDSARVELIVEGTLVVRGTSADPVLLTSSSGSSGDWYGIRVKEGGVARLRHCVIENVYKGLWADAPETLRLAHVEVDSCVTHGIHCEDCGATTKIDSCVVEGPVLIGIEARGCTDFTLKGNRISNATAYGIKCYDVASITVTGNYILGDSSSEDFVGIRVKPVSDTSPYLIEENTVERCSSRGIWCAKGLGDDASVEKNCISDASYTRGGTGVYFYKSSAKMRQTTVETKTHGVVAICGQSSPTSPLWVPDLGQSSTSPSEDGNNRFLDNSLFYIWTMGLGDSTMMAEQSWFGITPPNGRKFYGDIDYIPYLTSDPGSFPRMLPGDGESTEQLRLSLGQNWPNPFNPRTSILFTLPSDGQVSLRIYNAAGQIVRTLVDERRDAGSHEELWDGRDDGGRYLATGVYFARLVVDGETRVRKLALLK